MVYSLQEVNEMKINKAIRDLMKEKNVSRELALQMIYSNGYKIYTPQIASVQQSIDKTFSNTKYFYADRDGGFMQASIVIMDNILFNIISFSFLLNQPFTAPIIIPFTKYF